MCGTLRGRISSESDWTTTLLGATLISYMRGLLVRGNRSAAVSLALALTAFTTSARPQSRLEQIKIEYATASAELQKHLVDEQWIDDDQQSPKLLNRVWQLAAEWVAAWLDERPSATPGDLKTALAALASAETPGCLALDDNSFLVAAPGPIGNVFIVARSGDHYRLAWSTAQSQKAGSRQAELLAAWRAENARHGGRGPYWAASGRAGPVIPRLGSLPKDGQGHARFYIDGIYAQGAGGTVGAQTTVWVWDGGTARVLAARDYAVMIDQQVGTRLEGDLLKVQQKKNFRSFFSCGMCEERQTDWVLRITPAGVEDLGEKVVVPELDSVDELFYRLIRGRSATDLATAAVIQTAQNVLRQARSLSSEKEWKKFPSLGMMAWTIAKDNGESILCVATDDGGPNLFRLKPVGERFFITEMREVQSCEK